MTFFNPVVISRVSANVNTGVVSSSANQSNGVVLGSGTGTGNANTCISLAGTVTYGTPVTINVLTAIDLSGVASAMAFLNTVIVNNNSTTATDNIVVGGGTNPVLGSDTFTVQPNGGCGILFNPNPGYAVVSSSSDTITLTASAGTSVPYSITILGRTA